MIRHAFIDKIIFDSVSYRTSVLSIDRGETLTRKDLIARVIAQSHATCRECIEHGERLGVDDRTRVEAISEEVTTPEIIIARNLFDFGTRSAVSEWGQIETLRHGGSNVSREFGFYRVNIAKQF